MFAILVYTRPANPNQFFVPVGNQKDLAQAVSKIIKKGIGATITVYEVTPKTYNLTYKDKSRTVIDKIPEIILT